MAIPRYSEIYGYPATVNGIPQNWQPSSIVQGDWGTLALWMDGTNVTNYRNVPVKINSYTDSEPFGYKNASFTFPQITSIEAVPSWAEKFKTVQLILTRPNATTKLMWAGLVASDEDTIDDSGGGMTVPCIGILYQADLFLKKPSLTKPVMRDLYEIFFEELNPDLTASTSAVINRSGARWGAPIGSVTGIEFQRQGSWEPLLTGYFQDLLSQAVTEDGDQWTIDIDSDLNPTLQLKNMTTMHWSVMVGQRGVKHSLSKDYTMSPNAFYGDGTDLQMCHWRNTRYPQPDVDPSTYPDPPPPPGYTTGDVDRTGPFPTSLPFFQPAIEDVKTAYWWRTVAEGAIIGINPAHDPDVVRVENYQNFGSYLTREEGAYSAAIEFNRRQPSYNGSITLEADPAEGSRFEIEAGQNILLLNHRGTAGRSFHISDVETDIDSGRVTLQVDEAGRDYVTVAAVRNRERQNNDPSLRQQRTYRNSRAINDRKAAIWDCESGAGVIPATAVGSSWTIIRFAAGTVGTVINSFMETDPVRAFAAGVFDKDPTGIISGSPLTNDDYWDGFSEATGLIMAWGAGSAMAGYFPGRGPGTEESPSSDPVTGVHRDDASWYYETDDAPWLYLAVYASGSTTFSGLFRPGADY